MRALGRVIHGAYDLGALGATDEAVPLYERLGWRRWDGPLFALTPSGASARRRRRAPSSCSRRRRARPGGELTCDWRDGDVW